MLCNLFCYDKSFFAIPGFDQESVVTLYQSRNKRHLNPSLVVLTFNLSVDCPEDVGPVLSAQCGLIVQGYSCLAWQLYPTVEQDMGDIATVYLA
jgi:hypothetical protein